MVCPKTSGCGTVMNNITTSSDLSTKYIKHKGKIWTHTLTCGMKREIDYILINTKWKNSTLNCEAYNTFFTVGSDHRILTTKLRLSLRQSKSSKMQNVPQVSNDTAEKRRAVFEALDYSNLVKTRYSAKKFNDARIKPEEAYVKEQERYAQGRLMKSELLQNIRRVNLHGKL